MNKGVSFGDTILVDGERVEINKRQGLLKDGEYFDTVLSGGGYSASDKLLGVSYSAGRHSIVNELNGGDYHSIKIGRFKGETIAGYIDKYLNGEYETIDKYPEE